MQEVSDPRDLCVELAAELGIALRWEGKGRHERGVVVKLGAGPRNSEGKLKPGQVIVRVDPRYYRPSEVETLLGDASKAKKKLGWTPRITFKQLVSEMVREDLDLARRDELARRHGHKVVDRHE